MQLRSRSSKRPTKGELRLATKVVRKTTPRPRPSYTDFFPTAAELAPPRGAWYIDGRHLECENRQRAAAEKVVGVPIARTSLRMDFAATAIEYRPAHDFDWTETFDGVVENATMTFYFNFRYIHAGGGYQSRSAQCTDRFIAAQYARISRGDCDRIRFVNILDGGGMKKAMAAFRRHGARYPAWVGERIYIGSSAQFKGWWKDDAVPSMSLGEFIQNNVPRTPIETSFMDDIWKQVMESLNTKPPLASMW